MKSDIPKVLHSLGEKTLLGCVLGKCGFCQEIIVVLGHGAEKVRSYVGKRFPKVKFAYQKEQLGTAHALMCAMDQVSGDLVLVIPGDMPLVERDSLLKVVETVRSGGYGAVLVCRLDDPTGYGRVILKDGKVAEVVEETEATPEQKGINLVNAGVYCFRRDVLEELLPLIKDDNSKGEFYLTDIASLMFERGMGLVPVEGKHHEGMGVNSRKQLAEVYRVMSLKKVEQLMDMGITVLSPENTFIDEEVEIGRDTVIYPFVFIHGKTILGSGCVIKPFCVIKDSKLGDGVIVNEHSVLEQVQAEDGVSIGPFARLRPGTVLKKGSRIGNFVEVKKSVIGENSKANHLAYIGDATVGKDVNIGAGTITCNYDGVKKHPTVIEDGVFIGSDTQLVAPVKVGRGSLVGAGSTITKDIPPDSLALTRAPLRVFEGKGMRYFKKKKYGIEE